MFCFKGCDSYLSYRLNMLFRAGFILAGVMLVLACSDSKMEEKADVARRLAVITEIYHNGNLERALHLSRNLAKEYPDNPFAHGMYGLMLLESAKSDQSKQKIELGIKEFELTSSYFAITNEVSPKIVYGIGLSYASIFNELGRVDESIRAFINYYEPNLDEITSDPELRYSVIDYAEALAKKGYLEASYKVYTRTFKVDNTDARLVQGFIELESDYGDLQDAISFADAFIKKHGFNSRIIYEKCRSYYNHKLFNESATCFNELMPKINSNDVVFDAAKEIVDALEVQK